MTALAILLGSMSALAEGGGLNLGITMQSTKVIDKFSIISGAKLGYNFTSELYAGVALYGVTLFKNQSEGYDDIIQDYPTQEFNYYGIEFEYFYNPDNAFHISASGLIGISNTSFSIQSIEDANGNLYKPDYLNGLSNIIIVPSLNFNLNLKHFYRAALGFSYRIIPNFNYRVDELRYYENTGNFVILSNHVEGASINLTIKFGSF
jgi:hypothetical protein